MEIDEIIGKIKNNEEYKKFLILKEKMNQQGCKLDKKFAIFRDGKGDLNIADIYINLDECFAIDVKNEHGEDVGYMRIYFHPNRRFLLDVIYCYDAFRGRKIASNLSEIADYILQKYQGYIIRGVYKPGQLSTDRIDGIVRDKKELEDRADAFYTSSGYQKIEYKDFKEHPERYPEIDEWMDFQRGEGRAETIIAKKVGKRQRYPFKVINGVLVNENALERKLEFEGEEK